MNEMSTKVCRITLVLIAGCLLTSRLAWAAPPPNTNSSLLQKELADAGEIVAKLKSDIAKDAASVTYPVDVNLSLADLTYDFLMLSRSPSAMNRLAAAGD